MRALRVRVRGSGMGVRRSRSGALSLGARMRPLRQAGGSSAAASASPGVGEIWCSSVCSLSEYEYRLRHHQTSYLGGGTSSTVSNAYPPPAPHPLWQVREQVQQEHLCSCDNRCQHWPKSSIAGGGATPPLKRGEGLSHLLIALRSLSPIRLL